MTDHLPECPVVTYTKVIDAVFVLPRTDLSTTNLGKTVTVTEGDCICDRLRACEQRIREDDKNTFLRAAYDTGREDGVNAARDAVAAEFPLPRYQSEHDAALAAIDALRAGDHSAPSQPCGYSPTATDNRP